MVQIAREAGAHVIATGRGGAEALAKELGASAFINLERDPELTGAGQVDLVFDTVGGPVLERSAAVVKPGGTLVSITAPPPVAPVEGKAVFFIVESNRDQLREVLRLASEGRLQAHVGAVFPLSEAKDAFLAKRKGVPGKIVVR